MNPQVPGPKEAPPAVPPNVPASTPKTGWSPTLTWACVGGVVVTVLGGYFGQGRGRK